MTLFLPSVASLPVPIFTGFSSQRKVVRLPNGEKKIPEKRIIKGNKSLKWVSTSYEVDT